MWKFMPLAFLVVAACAEQPSAIEASYVSSNVYRGQSCGQLMAERNEIVREVNVLTKAQQKAADTDAALMGVGLILFWPAALAVGLTDDKADALAAAKGNYEAVSQRMGEQGCAVPAEPLNVAVTKRPARAQPASSPAQYSAAPYGRSGGFPPL